MRVEEVEHKETVAGLPEQALSDARFTLVVSEHGSALVRRGDRLEFLRCRDLYGCDKFRYGAYAPANAHGREPLWSVVLGGFLGTTEVSRRAYVPATAHRRVRLRGSQARARGTRAQPH
ncbi:MAG: hypothetical protein ACRDZO_01800 [Egibacteraceae bacterium]